MNALSCFILLTFSYIGHVIGEPRSLLNANADLESRQEGGRTNLNQNLNTNSQQEGGASSDANAGKGAILNAGSDYENRHRSINGKDNEDSNEVWGSSSRDGTGNPNRNRGNILSTDQGRGTGGRHRGRGHHKKYCVIVTGKVTCPKDTSKAEMVKVVLSSAKHDHESGKEHELDVSYTSKQGHYAVHGCTKSRDHVLHLHIFHKCGTASSEGNEAANPVVEKLKTVLTREKKGSFHLQTINLESEDTRPFESLRVRGEEAKIDPICLAT